MNTTDKRTFEFNKRVFEFMVSLSTNPAIFADWQDYDLELGSYGDHIKALAEELTDKYLENT